MKKVFVVLALMLLAPVFAYEVSNRTDGKFEKMTQSVGYTILNANKIPHRTNFSVAKKEYANAYATYSGKEIVVTKGLFRVINTEDELAAMLSHEISHIVDFNKGVMKGYFSIIPNIISPRKYEKLADKRAVDYMVNAGYNPVAIIVVLNKIGDEQRFEVFSSHPITSKRLLAVYEHIYKKYPQYLVNNSFKDDLAYQNFLLTSKDNRKKIRL